ncbi:MAG: tail fiber domain-containing protein [Chitinophagaceae bacterium]|nr:tail fiber domain-containing protein [Chitinophagaceae bacterium]
MGFTDAGQIGFIAQEVEKVFPELVVTCKDGYKAVDYSKITPVLLEAIKDQQKQIDELNRKVEKLISVIKN